MATKKNGEGYSSLCNFSTNITQQPKFFKIIVSPHECITFMIPEDFASRHCKNMQSCARLEVPSGEVWNVEVVHSEGQIWLAKGLKDFSNYYSINCGHLLVFKYNGRSHFNVIILDLSATEIEYPFSAIHGTRNAPNKNQVDSDDSVDTVEGVPRSHKGKEKISDMIEHSVEKIGHHSLGKGNKRKRQEEDAEEDVSIDMHTKKGSKGCRKHMQLSETVMDKEMAISYQRAKAFKSKNPFTLCFMQRSYVIYPFQLYLSLRFAGEYLLETSSYLVLRVPGRGSWTLKCSMRKSSVYIYWKAFVVDNKLKFGDACVFEVIKGIDQPILLVTIFRAARSTNCKTKNAKAENSVPGSPRKDSHTEELNQLRGGSYGFYSKTKEEHVEGTETEHSLESLDHFSIRQGSKRKKPEGDSDDDVSVAIHAKSVKVEKSQEDVTSTSYTRVIKRRGESCTMHNEQPKIVYFDSKKERNKERHVAYQRAKAFKSRNPFIVSVMKPPYISNKYNLTIPLEFAAKYFPDSRSDLMLCVPGRGSWSVRCFLEAKKAKICFGWKAFVLSNKLKFGDVCVFEVIDRTNLLIYVTIFQAAGTRQVRKMDTEVRKIVNDKSKAVKDKEGAIAYQRAKDFTSENPFLISFMQPSYVTRPYNLTIPLKFAMEYFGERIVDLMLCVPGRGSWSVRCNWETKKAKFHLGWMAFVLDNKLKVGDVCVFEVIKGTDQPLLHVTTFRAAGSTPMYKIDGHKHKVVQTNKLKKLRGGSYAFDSKIKEEHCEFTEIEHSVEIHAKSIEVEKSQEVVASPSFTRKTRRMGETSRMLNEQSKMVYCKDKERHVSYQRAKAFKSKNPLIISFIQSPYISEPYYLNINRKFATRYFRENCRSLLLRVPGRGSWSVKCFLETKLANFRDGWKAFVLDNKLEFGDVCVFEVIDRTKLLIDVTIFPAAGTTTILKTSKEVHRIENICQSSLGKANRRKRHEGDADDVSIDTHTEKSSNGCRNHKQLFTTVTEKERAISYQMAKAFKSKNPFFIRFMQPTYVLHPFNLSLAPKFAVKYLLKNSGDVVLRVPGRESWSFKCSFAQRNVRICWKAFVDDNKLKVGDTCVFEVIDLAKALIDVTIFPAAGEVPEMAIPYQRAQAFKSKNPFTISFMQPSYVSKSYNLFVPLSFATKYFQAKHSNLVLRIPSKGCWPARWALEKTQALVCSGWKAFVLDNKLKYGDVCVFEVINRKKVLIDVTIFPAGESKPTQITRASTSKNKIIKTEDSRCC